MISLLTLAASLCAAAAPDGAEGGVTPLDAVRPPASSRDNGFSWSPPAQVAARDDECTRAIDLVPGQPLPDGLLDEQGRVACRATVVPTSMALTLARSHAWAGQASPRGFKLTTELRYEREVNELLRADLAEPVPWWQRPRVQHDFGFAKGVVATVALALVVRETVTR